MSVDALKDVLTATVNMAEPMKEFAEIAEKCTVENEIFQKKLDEEILKLKVELKKVSIDQAEFTLLKMMYKVIFDETREEGQEEWATMLYFALREIYIVIVLTGEIPE